LTYSAFLVALFLGLVGCGRTQTAQTASAAERVKTLEARVARLEEDYRSAAATRDQARRQASQLQEQKTQLEEQVAKLTTDLEAQKVETETVRTALAQEQAMLRQRTGERDVLQTRCERLKKGLQTLIGQDDATTSSPVPPIVNRGS
jgi:TolA-binding protein